MARCSCCNISQLELHFRATAAMFSNIYCFIYRQFKGSAHPLHCTGKRGSIRLELKTFERQLLLSGTLSHSGISLMQLSLKYNVTFLFGNITTLLNDINFYLNHKTGKIKCYKRVNFSNIFQKMSSCKHLSYL